MSRLFLSHSSHDTDCARELKQRLLASPVAQDAGLDVWLDVDDLQEGLPWQQQLEEALASSTSFAVVVGSAGLRNWVRAETDLAMDRAINDLRFRIIPVLHGETSIDCLSPFARRYQAVHDPLNNPEAMQRLLRGALGLVGEALPALTPEPFPGLRSMTEEWADRFFGRRHETDQVLALLRRHRTVTIIADSGAGKSSLAQAGVAHAWRGGALMEDRPRSTARDAWHVLTMRPSEHPMERLRDAVESAGRQLGRDDNDVGAYRRALEPDPAFALRCGLDPTQCRILLIIDQAEELVTLTTKGRRDQFGALVKQLAESLGDHLRILVTVRSDHWNQLSTVVDLGELVRKDEAQFRLKQPIDLAEIVRGPLSLAGHTNSAEQNTLTDRLRNDLSDRPGDLALAQMALSLAWLDRHQHDGLLAAYAAGGGALAALGRWAERVETRLSHHQAQDLMPIFIRLIRLSETGISATRRIAARNEFDSFQLSLIDDLAGEEFGRLLQTRENQVEIAHEALITQWPSLHQYVLDHASEMRILNDLIGRARNWQEANRDTKHLTSLADEERFQQLRSDRANWLAPLEHEYLTWSEAGHKGVRREREALARDREQAMLLREQAVAAKNRLAWVGVALGSALFSMLSIVGWFAYQKNMDARLHAHAAAQSRADALALLARSTAETNPIGALKLALASWPTVPEGPFPLPAVAFDAINTAIAHTAPHRILQTSRAETRSAAFSSDGKWVVSGSYDGTLQRWEVGGSNMLIEQLQGNEADIRAMAFSPEGSRVLTGSVDGKFRLWDAVSGEPLGELALSFGEATGSGVRAVFSSDGRQLLTGDATGTLLRWDADSGAAIGDPVQAYGGPIFLVAFSLDNTLLVSGDPSSTLDLWDGSTGKQVGEPLSGHSGLLSGVAFSPDSRLLLSGSWDGALRLWEVDASATRLVWSATHPSLCGPLQNRPCSISSVAFSPDGVNTLSGNSDGTLQLWSAATGNPLYQSLQGHQGAVTFVEFSSDGSYILSGGNDGTLRLWNRPTSRQIGAPIPAHEGPVRTLIRSSGGLLMLSGDEDSMLRFVQPLAGLKDWIANIAFSPDGSQMASAGSDETLRLWDPITGTPVGTPFRGHVGTVLDLAFSPDGSRLLSGGSDTTLRLWDASTGVALGEPLKGHHAPVLSVAFSPDGRRLLSGGADGVLRLWDTATGESLGEPIRGHYAPVMSAVFSPDGGRLLSGGGEGKLRLWNASTGQQLGEALQGHAGAIRSVSFSMDGMRLLSASDDGTLRIWDAESGILQGKPLQGHTGEVLGASFSPDGKRLLSGSADHTVRLWDVRTGTQLGEPLRGHEDVVTSVAFSPDGSRMLSASRDGTMRLWSNLPEGNILQIGCRYLPTRNGRPEALSDGLADEIGIHDLTLPSDCDTYDPPLPVDYYR